MKRVVPNQKGRNDMRFTELSDRQRALVLALVMLVVSTAVAVVSGWALYRTAVEEQRKWMLKIVQTHAHLIEATVNEETHVHGSETISVILGNTIKALEQAQGFGKTGEFVVGRASGDHIEFLLPRLGKDKTVPAAVRMASGMAEPMRRALSGETGTVIGPDYRPSTVLAGFVPIPVLDVGLVAKIDLDEIRKPFINAGMLSAVAVLVLIAFGVVMARRLTMPLVGRLETSVDRLEEAQRLARVGNWRWDIAADTLEWSGEIYRIFGFAPSDFTPTYARFLDTVLPDDRDAVVGAVERSLREREPYGLDHRIVLPDGNIRTVREEGEVVTNPRGEPVAMVGTVQDITERKEIETRLSTLSDDLLRSNRDLEQFAYAASHDLQEPLRAISGYAQLLERRYSEKLDDKADEFIDNIVEGAARMQNLIASLLAYSRLPNQGSDATPFEGGAALNKAMGNLDSAIRETGMEIESEPLPSINGVEEQFVLVFQNLISNAIKFRSDDPPRVRIHAQRLGGEWRFSVADNGIGMEPQYAERIFLIFQRLHTRTDYPGEGVGLAICKRVIERHGGKIWVESAPGEGATFHFTLPA